MDVERLETDGKKARYRLTKHLMAAASPYFP